MKMVDLTPELKKTKTYKLTKWEMMLIAEHELPHEAFYDNGEIHVADIKTVGSWAWKYKYGRIKNGNPSIHQELQLGLMAMP